MTRQTRNNSEFQTFFESAEAGEAEAAYEMAETALYESMADSGLAFPIGMESDPEWIDIYASGASFRDGAREAFPELAEVSDEGVDDALFEMTEGMSEAEAAEFWKRIKRFARRAAGKVARYAAPVIRRAGQAVGGVIGGPAGAAIGGRIGRFAGRAVGRGLTRFSQTGKTPRIRIRRPTRANPWFNRQQVARGVNQLSGILNSPRVQQAIQPRPAPAAGNEMFDQYGEAIGYDSTIDEVAETILDLADQIEGLAEQGW